jgi:hypothetical protein
MQNEESQIELTDEIKSAVDNCDRACNAFRTLLDHWMRHSTEDKTFWMDRWKVGLFGQERIKTFKEQLNDYKSTLSVALSTASVYVCPLWKGNASWLCQFSWLTDINRLTTTRQGYLMKEMKDAKLQQNEAVHQREIARADVERTATKASLQQLSVGGSIRLSEESERSRQELLQEMRQQKASNDAFRRICEEALSRTVYERTGQKIKDVKVTNYSAALTGFINTSGEEFKIDQDISGVTADNWSIATAGVIKNVDFKDLRPTAPNNHMGSRQQ